MSPYRTASSTIRSSSRSARRPITATASQSRTRSAAQNLASNGRVAAATRYCASGKTSDICLIALPRRDRGGQAAKYKIKIIVADTDFRLTDRAERLRAIIDLQQRNPAL